MEHESNRRGTPLKAIQMICPTCGLMVPLAVETLAVPILCSCPICQTFFLHFHGKSFFLDQEKVRGHLDEGEFEKLDSYFRSVIEGKKETESHDPATGLPMRMEPINNDDICNLKIALGTCKSLEEFLKIT